MMARHRLQKKNNSLNRLIFAFSFLFFILPFFWFSAGEVNIGGDGGRLYYINPQALFENSLFITRSYNVYVFAALPYFAFMALLLKILQTPTALISFEYGIQLSFSFLSIVLFVKELLKNTFKTESYIYSVISILSGFFYIGMIAKTGWSVAMVTQNQVFLNVFITYLLYKFLYTKKTVYILTILILTIVYSYNFGLSSIPQLLSFYPLSFLFILLHFRFALQKTIPWKLCIVWFCIFIGIHSFHILPVLSVLFSKNSYVNTQVFSQESIQNQGLLYFDQNRIQLGKISNELFRGWLDNSWYSILIPLLVFAGVIKQKKTFGFVIALFFVITLFLVSANITQLGVSLYRILFSLPGFLMFRSFNEKWFFVFSFFYTLLFAYGMLYWFSGRKKIIVYAGSGIVSFLLLFPIQPLLNGTLVRTTIQPSNAVSTVFELDTDIYDVLNFIKTLPQDGKVVTMPLTYTYFQTIHGKTNGAYIGLSFISQIGGRQDIAGLWQLERFREPFLNAIKQNNTDQLIQLLSLLNIRYVVFNNDDRLFSDIPGFFDPSDSNSGSELPELMQSNAGYNKLLTLLPVKKIFEKGHFSIYEIHNTYIRPMVYIPTFVSNSFESLPLDNWSSAFGDRTLCTIINCDQELSVPSIVYKKRHASTFDIHIHTKQNQFPFMIVLTNPFDEAWNINFSYSGLEISKPFPVNTQSVGWIIRAENPENVPEMLHGSIELTYQKYLYYGLFAAFLTIIFLIVLLYRNIQKNKKHVNVIKTCH